MMNIHKNTRKRLVCLCLIIVVIAAGMLSRRIAQIPLALGDTLWAVMMFLMIRFLMIRARILNVATLSLLVCYLVELSQLYYASWIESIRATTLGALVLGRGFQWSDIVAYTLGITICALVEVLLNFVKQQK